MGILASRHLKSSSQPTVSAQFIQWFMIVDSQPETQVIILLKIHVNMSFSCDKKFVDLFHLSLNTDIPVELFLILAVATQITNSSSTTLVFITRILSNFDLDRENYR